MGNGSKTAIINANREKELNVLIGENIASLRNQKKLRQADVEQDLNLALHAVSKYERGEASFTPDIIEMFANYYKVPSWILSLDRVPEMEWFEIYDVAMYRLFTELPEETKRLYVAWILKDWQQSNPEQKVEERLEGRVLRYLKAFQKLSLENE